MAVIKEENYHDEQNKNNILKLRKVLDTLPPFCRDFFRGIEPYTSTRTRLAYAYDIRLFFEFLHETNSFCKKREITELPLSVLDMVQRTDIEEYLEYMSLYQKDGKDITNEERGKARKLAALRSFYNYYFQSERIEKNTAALVPLPKRHEKEIIRLEPNEVAILLDQVEDGTKLTKKELEYHKKTKLRDVALLTLLLGTGIRVSECVGLDINDVERVPLGDFTYQWRNIYDRTPLHGKCRIILSYRSYTIAHFNKDGILDGLYEKYEDNHLVQKLTYVKGILRGKGYEYYTDGTVKKECVWNEQGKIDGLMIEYNRIGRTEWDYKNGEVDGQQRTFDNNGQLITFVSYSKGMQHGPFRIYEEGGTDMPPFIREGYAWGWRGKKGEYKETWALSGKPKCIEHYTEKGEKTGRWQEWDENGKLVREENYTEMPYYSVKFDKNSYPLERYYYNEDLSVKSIQEFYPGTDKIMKEEYNLDFKNFKRDYRQFYEDGTIQEEGHMKGGEVVFAKEYYKNKQLKCVKKIQSVYGYKILTVTELYDESGKPLPIPSGTF